MSATASRYSTEYFVPPHDPILGIYDRHIAPAITLENWHHKAIISGQKNNPTYIYIARGEITRLNRKIFSVNAYNLNKKSVTWRRQFATPEAAVGWINKQF